MIRKEHTLPLWHSIHLVCFRSATKSFRPIWEGRTLTQKCRDRWFNALKNDKSQKANADVVA